MERYGESAHRLRLEPFSLGPFGGDSPAFFFLLSPLFSLPANIPVIFELTILFSALTTVGLMFAFNGLPQLYHPLFRSKRFRRASDDRFFVVIEARDPRYFKARTSEFLESLDPVAVEEVED